MLSHLVPSFSKLTASTIVGNMTATSKTFGYLGIINHSYLQWQYLMGHSKGRGMRSTRCIGNSLFV